ncbi:hypothetical protein ACHHYP_02707 [Achlya hypogyna]|uniref:FYVE-type domain-containing protein n=1 Tax=Achlya hypogyna TaxID=1202772 RepID=A0A1V9ZSM4_ACHHY|nr:hypothetical protein ACHHYP_02707 [Achlya hypogyna]
MRRGHSQHDASSAHDFLLPYGFFDCLPLNPADLEYLGSLARHTWDTTLAALQCRDATAWNSVGDIKGAHVFQGKPRPSEPHIVPFRASATLAATLDEVVDLMSNATGDQVLYTLRHCAEDILDMKVLYTLESSAQRRVLVRWYALACPTPLQNRDFCVVEVQDAFALPSGLRAWAIAQHSVRLPSCPDLKSAFQLVRGAVANSGLLVVETAEAGVLHAHSHCEMDFKGALPSFLYKKLMKRRASHLTAIDTYVHDRRVQGCFQPSQNYVPAADRSHCSFCSKRFHAFRHKYHCATCGDVFCSKCTGAWKARGGTQRVCVNCSGGLCESYSDAAQSPVFGLSPHHAPRTFRTQSQRAPSLVSPVASGRPQYSPSCTRERAVPSDDPLLAAWNSLRLSTDVPLRDMQSEKTTSTLEDLCEDHVTKLLSGSCDWEYDPTATIDMASLLASQQQSALERSFGYRKESQFKDFPLPPDFFRREPLTTIETRYLESLGEHNIRNLLLLQASFYDDNLWPCVKDTPEVRLFQGLAPPSEPCIIPFRAATTIQANFRELTALLANLTAEQMDAAIHKYAFDVLDMTILYEIPTPSPETTRMLVRWMATECPTPLRSRDFCLLEVHHQTTLASGRRAYVISQHSIRLPCCPDLKSAFNLVRGSIYNSGTIIVETSTPGVLEVQTHMQMALKGRVPAWLHKYVVRQRAGRLQSLHASLQDYRLTDGHDASYIAMVPFETRPRCTGCHKAFNVFPKWRRKHHCEHCGEVYCRRCARTTTAETKGRVCYACVGLTVESSVRSPFRSGGAEYSNYLFEDDDDGSIVGARTTGHEPAYQPSTSSATLLQLLDAPPKARDDGLCTPDVAMEAIQFNWLSDEPQDNGSFLPMLEVDASSHVLRLVQGAEPWTRIKEAAGLTLYQGRSQSSFQAATTVTASLDELSALLTNATTAQMRANIGQHVHTDVLDSNILHAIGGGGTAFIRWFAIECPGPMRNRDFCVLEAHDVVRLPSGARALVISQHSVPYTACPENEVTLHVVRGTMHHSGLVATEVAPDQWCVQLFLHMDLHGRGPAWLHKHVVRSRAMQLLSLHGALTALRRTRASLSAAFPLYSGSHSDCSRCHKRVVGALALGRRPAQCHACCKVFCRHCTVVSPTKERVCIGCYAATTTGCFRSPYPSSLGSDLGAPSPCRQYSPNVTRQQLAQWIEPKWCEGLSSRESEYLGGLAQTNLDKLVEDQDNFYNSRLWPCVRETPGLRLFQGPTPTSAAPFRAATTIQASFAELIALFTAATLESGQLSTKQAHDDVVDSAVLVHVASSLPTRRIFVRWMAVECPKPLRNRDFCVLEVHDQVTLASGHRAYVISQHSIRLACCPDMESTIGLVRGSIYNSGLVILETSTAGVLEVRSHVDMDMKGRVPSWLHSYMVRQRAERLRSIHLSVQSSRAKASFGEAFFRQWHRKHNCVLCGEIFCRQCTRACTAEPHKRMCNSCVGSMVEYTLRSPYTSRASGIEAPPLFEDDAPKPCRQYQPSTMRANLLQLIEPPTSQRRRPAVAKSPDVTLEALRMEYGAVEQRHSRTILFPTDADALYLPLLDQHNQHADV